MRSWRSKPGGEWPFDRNPISHNLEAANGPTSKSQAKITITSKSKAKATEYANDIGNLFNYESVTSTHLSCGMPPAHRPETPPTLALSLASTSHFGRRG